MKYFARQLIDGLTPGSIYGPGVSSLAAKSGGPLY